MIPATIADLIITGLILGYGQKIGGRVENVQDMTKSIIDNLPALIQTSQELQMRLTALRYRPRLYETLTIDLSTARSKVKYDVTGSCLLAQSVDGTLEVRFNEQDAAPVTVNADNRVYSIDFDCLYVTNTAQSGKSVTFVIGKGHAFVGSTITPTTINDQNVGILLQPEWAAKENLDKSIRALGTNKAFEEKGFTTYDVPAGKTLYIVSVSFVQHVNTATDYDHHLWGIVYLSDNTTATTLCKVPGHGGGSLILPKPVVIPAEHEFLLEVINYSNVNCYLDAVALGYEV
ncbi:MAG: hypothetical protein ACTSPB_07115 [Candidatus Thorarchaeota archaeon]